MSIHEIENLSFAELKEKRAEITEALKGIPVEELANRYLQARTDAKQRDDKLSEQGKTITALQDGLAASKQQTEVTQAEVQKALQAVQGLEAKLVHVGTEFNDFQTKTKMENEELKSKVIDLALKSESKISELTERCERLKVQAGRYATAISGIQKMSLDAINSQVLDNAETG